MEILTQAQLITLDSMGYYVQVSNIVGEQKKFNLLDKKTGLVVYSNPNQGHFKVHVLGMFK